MWRWLMSILEQASQPQPQPQPQGLSYPNGVPYALVPLVQEFEGLHKVGKDGLIYPYICPAGYPTQGWGIRVASMSVPPITREEADRRLIAILPSYLNDTIRLCPVLKEDPIRLAAVTDFVFNLGATAFAGSTFRKRLLEKNWEAAAAECKRWKFGGGKILPGLVRRRNLEAEYLLYPERFLGVK